MNLKRKYVMAALGIALVIGIGVLGDRMASAGNAADPGTEEVRLLAGAPSRAEIIARVTAMTAIAKRVDRIDARLTTWGTYLSSHDIGFQFVQEIAAASTPVWVVAVAGDFVPAHARDDETYSWGVIVFDATNGDWLHTLASHNGSWPSSFDALH